MEMTSAWEDKKCSMTRRGKELERGAAGDGVVYVEEKERAKLSYIYMESLREINKRNARKEPMAERRKVRLERDPITRAEGKGKKIGGEKVT